MRKGEALDIWKYERGKGETEADGYLESRIQEKK